MKNHVTALLLAISAGAMSVACGSDDSNGSGGSGGMGNVGGNGGMGNSDLELKADATGYVQNDAIGIKGAWYAYADSIGSNGMPPGNCQTIGMHPDSECAQVTSPAPGSFPNTDNKLCTEGTVEAVGMLNGMPDYSNQWGAGIGLDFNNAGMGATKMPFNAQAAGVKGVSFEIDMPPGTGLRVEFPDAATDGKSAAYWGATSSYGPSPVKAGLNTITWDKVVPPEATIPMLDTTKLMGIQFHVPTSSTKATYKFCISKLSVIK
ncbi:MAG: hypothetical protein ACOY0T_40500 [Myxococcota bacterium]